METNGEIVRPVLSMHRVQPEPEAKPNLLGLLDPEAFLARATRIAAVLERVLTHRKLTLSIQGRDHVRVEGWQLLGAMLGITPVCVWTKVILGQEGAITGWAARVEARASDGSVVGGAEASCDRAERTWSSRDEHALRSMAQTRATAKALRQATGAIMVLTGFEGTPAEEMPDVPDSGHLPIRPPSSKSQAPEGKPQVVEEADKAVTPQKAAATISSAQARRFFAMAQAGNKTQEQIQKALAVHGWERTDQISRGKVYSDLCAWGEDPHTGDYKETTR